MEKKQSKQELRMEKRKALVAKRMEELEQQGYERHDLTIPANIANTVSMLYVLPFIAVYVVIFGLTAGWEAFSQANFIIIFPAFLISLGVHELLHGLPFALFSKDHFADIEFGILWKSLNPYCCCTRPLNKKQYLIAILTPMVVLGFVVGAIAIAAGSATWLVFALLSIFGACADFMIACKLMVFRTEGDALFYDHPTLIGLLGFVKKEA